jgi:short-subunit dehydrogenase
MADSVKHQLPRIVFITGASSGIGQALAWRFYEAGYTLALAARRGSEMQDWAIERQLDPQRYRLYSVDVADPQAMLATGQACIENQGLPAVVIANAGISIGIDTGCRDDIDVMAKVFATNNLGMMATFHPFVNAMVARAGQAPGPAGGLAPGGILVGIASVAGIRGLPGHGAYCASKSAAITYCESLRGELRSLGVRVVTICPGYIDTPLTRENRYPMPFLMSAEAFAARAFVAIEKCTSYSVIPWQMGVVAKILRVLPNAIFDRLLTGRPRKHRAAVKS